MCEYGCLCIWVPVEPGESGLPETELWVDVNCLVRGLRTEPLEEQPALSTSEPFLQPPGFCFGLDSVSLGSLAPKGWDCTPELPYPPFPLFAS